MKSPVGVLMMAYGGPASLDEIPGYLADIRSGRTTPKRVLDEIVENYRSIGGRSPLPEITAAQMKAVAARFDPSHVKFYAGMRHWSPWIEDTVARMVDDGVEKAVSIVLAPHYSSMSIAKYHDRIRSAMALHRATLQWDHVLNYHEGKPYIQALVNRVRDGISRWPESERTSVHVVLSAHSLPERIVKEGDPYRDQLLRTAELVAAGAGLSSQQWSWAFQSAGRTPEPWLGPALDDHLTELAGKGVRNVVSIPIGFVADHVEILFDIDIKAQETCRKLGLRLERPPALNDDPLFIDQLEQVLRPRVEALF